MKSTPTPLAEHVAAAAESPMKIGALAPWFGCKRTIAPMPSSSIKPYYDQDGVTLYHGDAREIGLSLQVYDAIITDPVWPNADPSLAGADDPLRLFTETMDVLCGKAKRVVVHLGCDSDPPRPPYPDRDTPPAAVRQDEVRE